MPTQHTHFLASLVGSITRFRPVDVGEVRGGDSAEPTSRLNQHISSALEWNDGMEAGSSLPCFVSLRTSARSFGAPQPGGGPESLLTLQKGRQSPEPLASRFLAM